jgi:predicted branched-subunit amino acid permease
MNGSSDTPRLTAAGMREGVRLTLPMLPGVVLMSAAFGTVAAQKGLTLLEAALMSGLLFAGASQLVAMEVWPSVWTLGAVITLAVVVATVNMRYLLMGAALRPWLGPGPAWQSYTILLSTVDANWIVAMRYRSEGGSDSGVILGSGIVLWLFWVGGTIPGHLLGVLVNEPKRFGLDLVLPIFFAAMLVPLWRGPRRGAAWVIAGAVALLTSHLVPGYWFIMAGAIAGSVAGGFLDDGR